VAVTRPVIDLIRSDACRWGVGPGDRRLVGRALVA